MRNLTRSGTNQNPLGVAPGIDSLRGLFLNGRLDAFPQLYLRNRARREIVRIRAQDLASSTTNVLNGQIRERVRDRPDVTQTADLLQHHEQNRREPEFF